ncbi:MAG: metallophosphoesterase [candidate division Zixibacteria bacterium]|nr:metallophosphoesterase [candidate division Zixibacteria bacterium]
MKIAFFSDVHANLAALKAFRDDIRGEKVDKVFFLGDAVGYGPNPNECLEIVCGISEVCLMGNHDYAALGLLDTSGFNQYAREAIDFTERILTEENKSRIAEFELEYQYEDFHMVHSTPEEPGQWDYIVTLEDADVNFGFVKRRICLIGHSHYPAIICKDNGAPPALIKEQSVKLDKKKSYIINIGSVGQPRDNDPRSCYLIYDTKKREARLKRVEYDIADTQNRMREVGLPDYLINRLEKGR